MYADRLSRYLENLTGLPGGLNFPTPGAFSSHGTTSQLETPPQPIAFSRAGALLRVIFLPGEVPMAWIESHQEIARHPKTRKLARLLGVNVPTVIGHLHMLWYYCLDFAQDGNIGKIDSDEVAEAVHYDGGGGRFIEAMVQSGWADERDDSIFVHDWFDYAGRLVNQRRAKAQRNASTRQTQAANNRLFSEIDELLSSSPSQTETIVSHQGSDYHLYRPTVQYRTVPNQDTTLPDKTTYHPTDGTTNGTTDPKATSSSDVVIETQASLSVDMEPGSNDFEKGLLTQLRTVPFYPFKLERDIRLVRMCASEFGEDVVKHSITAWCIMRTDNPLPASPKKGVTRNPRLEIYNWCKRGRSISETWGKKSAQSGAPNPNNEPQTSSSKFKKFQSNPEVE